MPETYMVPSSDDLKLAVTVFRNAHPIGVVQVIHGALEHKERYFDFAAYLNSQGYVVLLSDNRGHGASISSNHPYGVMRDWHQLINDQVTLSRHIRFKYPKLPLFLFGHSFGSILARLYLQDHDQEIAGLILTGTAKYVPIVPLGLLLGKGFLSIHNWRATSPLLSRLSGLTPGKHDWLSYNRENIQRVTQDPLMMDQYPVISLLTLWRSNFELKRFAHFHPSQLALPILSITGDHDKFSGGRRGLKDTVTTLQKIGYQNIQTIVMPKMKYEVLNEDAHLQVYRQISKFLGQYRQGQK